MSKQDIVERILSDAREEAAKTLKLAEEKATKLKTEANARAEKLKRETEQETKEYERSVLEKKAAAARLECAKILLKEKRNAIDTVYALALQRLISLDKESCLQLCDRLLKSYAEEGDELYFAENFIFVNEVKLLPIVQEKKLKISSSRLPLDGGFKLVGEKADKDLSYGALLTADREKYQSTLAPEIF